MGIPATLIVALMVANSVTIADRDYGGRLDVVGVDASAPAAMAAFARGVCRLAASEVVAPDAIRCGRRDASGNEPHKRFRVHWHVCSVTPTHFERASDGSHHRRRSRQVHASPALSDLNERPGIGWRHRPSEPVTLQYITPHHSEESHLR